MPDTAPQTESNEPTTGAAHEVLAVVDEIYTIFQKRGLRPSVGLTALASAYVLSLQRTGGTEEIAVTTIRRAWHAFEGIEKEEETDGTV
jgi:hypothetical protein